MRKTILLLVFILQVSLVFGQSEIDKAEKNLGVNYFGELGLRPGVEVDYGIPLLYQEKIKEDKKRGLVRFLHLRPSLGYYRFAHNSNNFLLAGKLNYQFRFVKKSNQHYFFIEPFIKAGYHRKSFIGEIYQTTSDGFKEVKIGGSNSLVLGSGVDFGGYLSEQMDWLFGVDYFIERTEDQLILHRFASKLGVRIKLN